MNSYIAGTLVRMSASLAAVSGGAAVDATIGATVLNPDGTETVLSVVRDGPGLYHADLVPAGMGLYQYEFVATGVAQVVAMGQFLVTEMAF